jgi:hypothetical protein
LNGEVPAPWRCPYKRGLPRHSARWFRGER